MKIVMSAGISTTYQAVLCLHVAASAEGQERTCVPLLYPFLPVMLVDSIKSVCLVVAQHVER